MSSIYDVHAERGSGGHMWMGVGRVNSMWTSTRRIGAHWHQSCLLLMQRSWFLCTKMSSLDGI